MLTGVCINRVFAISGGSSSIEKTTITLGLMNLLKNMSLSSFDLIDFDLNSVQLQDSKDFQIQVRNILSLKVFENLVNIENIRSIENRD